MREEYIMEVKINSNQNFLKLFSLRKRIEETQSELITMSIHKEKLVEKIEFSINKFLSEIQSVIQSQESQLEPSTSESLENKNRKRRK
jgi:hypothetical protein